MYQLIQSGSEGNSVLYHGSILVDCGVSFASLKPYLYNIQIVLLTHEHKDHINIDTLKKLVKERPTLRIGCGEWMKDKVAMFKKVDILEIGNTYDYGQFQISPVKLYHDVPNCGYRIFKNGTKIFHATDTAHLEGITAQGYDLFAIEHNYNEETVFDVIREKESRGEYAHQRGSINSHLSEQKAKDFIFKNRSEFSQVLRLHESSSSL